MERPNSALSIPIQLLFCIGAVISLIAVCPLNAQDPETGIRVMSFNIRYGAAKDGPNHWDFRKPLVVEAIRNFDPDIVGTQETLEFQAAFLREKLSDHDDVGRSREPNSQQGEQCSIFFRQSRFDKLIEGHFWLSESPDQPGSKSWDSSLPRMVTWLKLWDRRQQQSFFVVNTHFDHRGQSARIESAKLIRKFIADLGPAARVIVTGDFNAAIESQPYQEIFSSNQIQNRLIDTFQHHFPDDQKGQKGQGTFNGFAGLTDGARIDWIATTDNWEIKSAGIDRTEFDGRYPSDHFPVTAVLEYK